MKRALWGLVVTAFFVSSAGCGKFGAKKGVAPEDVGKALATVLCEKHAGCQQPGETFNKDQCLQEIAVGLSDRIKGKPDLKVQQAMLDACSKTISSGDCSILVSEAPPAGCEFLE